VIKFGNKTLKVQVNQLFETTKKADADSMYTVIDEHYERDFSQE
jgi:ribosomal 50S subunit-recycling heat shock protein